jgi:hypothetical protein
MYSVGGELSKVTNQQQLEETIRPTSRNRAAAGVNFSYIAGVPMFGAKIGYERDKAAGIETTYQSLTDKLKTSIGPLVDNVAALPQAQRR